MNRHIGIYLRRKKLIIHPDAVTTSGVLICSEPCIALDISVSDEDIGRAVNMTLSEAGHRVPHPKQNEWDLIPLPILNTAGIKKWSTFVKGAKFVSVTLEGQRLICTPYKKDGHGFEGIKASAIEIEANARLHEIGSTIRNILENAR